MRKQITMLVTGNTSTGKTVAACNVFHHMTNEGGVSAKAGDKELNFSLVATSGCDSDFFDTQYINMITGEPLPPGSTENASYELIFNDQEESIANILYLDYRGGMIKDDKNEEKTKQQELEKAEFDYVLSHTGILIYIIPGDLLQKYIDLSSLEAGTVEYELANMKIKKEISLIKTLQQHVTNELENRAPILYYVTKSDLVAEEEKIIPALEELIRKWKLQPKGRKILGCHSTIGRNAVVVEENIANVSVSRIVSGFAPEGFEIPMLLTVGYRLSKEGAIWADEQEKMIADEIDALSVQKNNELAAKGAANNELSGLTSGIRGFFTSKKKKEQKRNEISQQDNKIMEIDNKINKKTKEKQSIADRNVDKQHSQNILDYLNAKHPNQVLYLDENGNRSPLEKFFK